MTSLRSLIGVLVALALLAAACSSDDASDDSASQTAGADAGAAASASATDEDGAVGEDPSDSEASGATRTVTHPLGEVVLPAQPQRWVALDEGAAMILLELGVTPVETFSQGLVAAGDVLESEGITVTPNPAGLAGLNFEAVAEAEPDAIIASFDGAVEPIYDELNAIAPTVVLPFEGTWQSMFRESAVMVGAEAEAEPAIAALEARTAEVASLDGDDLTISTLGAFGSLFFTQSSNTPIDQVLNDAGVTRPPAQAESVPDPTLGYGTLLSEEVLPEHDADLLLLFSGAFYDSSVLTELPVYNALGAVQDDRVVEVDGEMWFVGYPFTVSWVLDDLEILLAGGTDVASRDDVLTRWADYRASVEAAG
ncbi:MAG: ABC transporter substrate-binding protein [Actinomycetota bacterium]